MKAGDIVKIPASWPDYKQCGNDDFVDIDNISKYAVPLNDGTDATTSIKLYLSRRHSVKNQFWTADRNQTDFTALDVSDFMTRDRDSACKCQGGDDNTCNCQRPNGTGPFLGQAPIGNMGNLGNLGQSTTDSTNLSQVVSSSAGDEANIISTCSKEAVADIQANPQIYQELLNKYGSDQAIADEIVKRCKEYNADLIADANKDKGSSFIPQFLFGLGLCGIIGGIVVLVAKGK